jgi:hypothetical protein
MQDPKFMNFFFKNPFKIVILIFLSFFCFFNIYVLNFSSHKDEHNLLFCMQFFNNYKTFSYQNQFFSSFFCISWINHNKVHQSFEELASPIKNLYENHSTIQRETKHIICGNFRENLINSKIILTIGIFSRKLTLIWFNGPKLDK